ncbi:MAG: ParB N-terminal domain-containing protein [Sulfolobales archaeon]
MIPAKTQRITQSGISLKIFYADPEDLKPHEESIYERIQQVRLSLVRTGVLRRPLIVDEKTGVIIDGTHRYEALKRIGACRIPVVGVDYLSEDEVRIASWVRVYILKKSLDADSHNISDLLAGVSGVDMNMSRVGRTLLISINTGDPQKIYREIAFLEKNPAFMYKVDRVIYRSRINHLELSRTPAIALILPPLGKEDVVKAGLSRKPFPPKSTRHLTILKRLELRIRVKELTGGSCP